MIAIRALLAASLIACATPVQADSFPPPRTQRVLSADQQARVTVVPNWDQPGRNESSRASATVEILESGGRWRPLWKGPLLNRVAPSTVLLANGGLHLVTFDNHAGLGHGNTAIVIYDRAGRLVKQIALEDFLPRDFYHALPRTISTIGWRRDVRFSSDQSHVLITVASPRDDFEDQGPGNPFRLRVSDGLVRAVNPVAFEEAVKQASVRLAGDEEERLQWLAERARPFPSPRGRPKAEWDAWMQEFQIRGMRYFEGAPSITMLPAKGDPEHAEKLERLNWMVSSLTNKEKLFPGVWAFGSVERGEMARELMPLLVKVPAGAWAKYRVVYLGEAERSAGIAAAVKRTGADYSFIDLDKPLPGVSKGPARD